MSGMSGIQKGPARYTERALPPEFPVVKYRYRRDVQSLVALGRAAFEKEDYATALRYFMAALQMEPRNHLVEYFKKKTEYKIHRLEVMRGLKEEARAEAERRLQKIAILSGPKCSKCSGGGMCTRCGGDGQCPSCTGTGWRDLLGKQCSVCGGNGECDSCHGSKRCVDCGGNGVMDVV